jgi:DNA repair protein RadC
VALVRELRLAYVALPAVDDLDARARYTQPSDAAAFFAEFIGREPVECFAILLLDTKRRTIGALAVTRGTLSSTLIDARSVFTPALIGNASAVITAHNHPSGDTTPSPDDLATWARLNAAGDILGIDVLDHLIVTHSDRFYSARQSGAHVPSPQKD